MTGALRGFDRVVIVGTSGAGKSTLSRRLSEITHAPVVEVDGLYHRPNWTLASIDEFRGLLADVAAQPRWIVDGNYFASTEQLIWPRAQVIVWLDLPLPLILLKLVRRSVRRVVRRVELWHGNTETWKALLSRQSILLWAVTSHAQHRRELPVKLVPPNLPTSATVLRFTHPREVEDWLETLRRAAA